MAEASIAPRASLPMNLLAWARAQWVILKICLEERLVYRGDFALGTVMRFLPIVTQIFLWGAVFQAVGGANSDTGERSIMGYTYNNFIAYYLLTYVSRAFSSMPGLASGIARDIRDGTIKKYLIQPVDMLGFLFWNRVAHKLVYYLVATLPLAILFFLCRGFFDGWPDATTLAAYFFSLILAFLLGFLLESTMGMTGFWLMEVSSLVFVFMLFSFFFSGHMFPIDMLPDIGWFPLSRIVELLPLPYLAYFPSAVFLGKIQGWDLVRGLGIQFGWVIGMLLINRAMFHQGVKRYSGYGG